MLPFSSPPTYRSPIPFPKTGSCVGIDMNLTNLYTDSDGNVIPNPKYGRGMKKKLAKAQRKLSRMKEAAVRDNRSLNEASNYQKQRLRTAVLQRKVSRSREDYLQVQTKRLVESQDLIVSEDLKVKNMLRNHKLAYGIADVTWGSFFILLQPEGCALRQRVHESPCKGHDADLQRMRPCNERGREDPSRRRGMDMPRMRHASSA